MTTRQDEILGPREAMLMRLLQIHDDHAGEDTDEGAMIVTFEGYIRGEPEFFTNDTTEAFTFQDREQAESFIADFGDVLLNPQVLDHP